MPANLYLCTVMPTIRHMHPVRSNSTESKRGVPSVQFHRCTEAAHTYMSANYQDTNAEVGGEFAPVLCSTSAHGSPLQASALLLVETFMALLASAPSGVMTRPSLQRLLFDVFHEDMDAYRTYCLEVRVLLRLPVKHANVGWPHTSCWAPLLSCQLERSPAASPKAPLPAPTCCPASSRGALVFDLLLFVFLELGLLACMYSFQHCTASLIHMNAGLRGEL